MDIDNFSTHDGSGIRTAVFLKGCPLSCRWCHSPESQSPCPELLYQRSRCTGCLRCVKACAVRAVVPDETAGGQSPASQDTDGGQPGITVDRNRCLNCFSCASVCYFRALRVCGSLTDSDDLAARIADDLPFFSNSGGGVTLSGGEPLAQARFTAAFLSACQKRGIHTLLETCGYGAQSDLLETASHCNAIFFDVKILNPEKHREWTGVSNELILNNLNALCAEGFADRITVRTPCIPGVNDSPEEIEAIAKHVRDMGVRRFQLLPYNPMSGEKYKWIDVGYTLSNSEPRDKAYYETLNLVAEKTGLTVSRG